jgi:hypothetical protein
MTEARLDLILRLNTLSEKSSWKTLQRFILNWHIFNDPEYYVKIRFLPEDENYIKDMCVKKAVKIYNLNDIKKDYAVEILSVRKGCNEEYLDAFAYRGEVLGR